MNKRMKRIFLALLIIFGALIAYNIIKQSLTKYYLNHYQVPAVTVAAVQIKPRDWHPYLSSIGTFVAINGVEVNTQSAGKVTKIYFNSGEYVEKDRPLIDIDDSVEQAQLKFHQANLILQQANYQRQTDLLKRNATSASVVDEARAKMLQAQANVENTQATIDLKHIKAPFTGELGIRQIDLGQYIQPGITPIVSLQSLNPIYLNFYIPEQYINSIKTGQNIHFSIEQNPDQHFRGKITAINSKVDEKTHNIQVQATVENFSRQSEQSPRRPERSERSSSIQEMSRVARHDVNQHDMNFIPGMFAKIEVEQPVLHDVLAVPSTAISYTMYGDSVFIVNQHKNNAQQNVYTVKRVYVTPGDTQGNYTIIKQGIQANQIVVTAGELKLQDGTEVVIDSSHPLIDHADINLLGE